MSQPKKKPRAKTSPRKKPAAKKPVAAAVDHPSLAREIADDVQAMLTPAPRKKGFWARLFGL